MRQDMTVFYLEPKGGNTSDPSWELSILKEGCWTETATEQLAREQVVRVTVKVPDANTHSKLGSPPWTQPRLTDCKPDKPPQNIPTGKVLTKSLKILGA
jgi:hypothetical protein